MRTSRHHSSLSDLYYHYRYERVQWRPSEHHERHHPGALVSEKPVGPGAIPDNGSLGFPFHELHQMISERARVRPGIRSRKKDNISLPVLDYHGSLSSALPQHGGS